MKEHDTQAMTCPSLNARVKQRERHGEATASPCRRPIPRPTLWGDRRRDTFRRGTRLLVLLVLSALGGLSPAWVLEVQAAADEIRLVSGGDYPPFTDPEAPEGGVIVEIVQAVFNRIGQGINLTYLPSERGYQLTQSGHFDATFPYQQTAEREIDFLFSDPIFYSRRFLFLAPPLVPRIRAMTDLAGLRLCLPLGWSLPRTLKGLNTKGRLPLTQPPALVHCLRMIAVGRVDALVADMPVFERALTASGVARSKLGLAFGGSHLEITSLHMLFPRRHPQAKALQTAFDQALGELRVDGSYKAILDRHWMALELRLPDS